jgi:hypothetical protein
MWHSLEKEKGQISVEKTLHSEENDPIRYPPKEGAACRVDESQKE